MSLYLKEWKADFILFKDLLTFKERDSLMDIKLLIILSFCFAFFFCLQLYDVHYSAQERECPHSVGDECIIPVS